MPVETIVSVNGVKYTNGDGYYFRLSQRLNSKMYLNCQVRSCQVRGNLPQNYGDNDEINVRGDHNHPPDFFELEFCDAERRILERAARDPASLRKIFKEETANVSPKTVSRLNYPSFLRRMQRRRQNDIRKVPNCLEDFSKRMRSPEYQSFAKIDDKDFFISTINNHSILFISPTMRELLCSVKQTFIIHQTKKFICEGMKNVLIISQVHSNVVFPIVYVAMKHRTPEAFVDVFREIVREEPSWNPTTMLVNREESLMNAIEKVFSRCEIAHCWFHLAQELRREMKNLDLIYLLHSDPDFYNCVELLQGVPLLPSEFMCTGFEIVKNMASSLMDQPGVSQLFDFVAESWLSESIIYQISLFGRVERLKAEIKLLHRQFVSSFRANARKEMIWSFTKGLVLFEKKYADAYRELFTSKSPPKWTCNSTCKSQEKKILSLMESFGEAELTIESFLEQFARTGINVTDLADLDMPEISDEDNEMVEKIKVEHAEISSEVCIDFDDYIVEEVEECVESDDAIMNCDKIFTCSKVKTETKENSSRGQKRKLAFKERTANKLRDDTNGADVNLVFSSAPVETFAHDLKMAHACVKCEISVYAYACQPCGHLCLCSSCCKDITQKKCPMCSKTVLWVQEIIPVHPFRTDIKYVDRSYEEND